MDIHETVEGYAEHVHPEEANPIPMDEQHVCFRKVSQDCKELFAASVGKLCVFQIKNDGENEPRPLIQGSVIKINEDPMVLVTVGHLFPKNWYDSSRHRIFVNFNNHIMLPKLSTDSALYEELGWIPVKLYQPEDRSTIEPCPGSCSIETISDFAFLIQEGTRNLRLSLPMIQLNYGYREREGYMKIIGFLSSDEMSTPTEVRAKCGREISDQECRDIVELFKDRLVFWKTVSFSDSHELACDHTLLNSCICGNGYSGAIVLQVHGAVKQFGAIHLGTNMIGRGLALLSEHVLRALR